MLILDWHDSEHFSIATVGLWALAVRRARAPRDGDVWIPAIERPAYMSLPEVLGRDAAKEVAVRRLEELAIPLGADRPAMRPAPSAPRGVLREELARALCEAAELRERLSMAYSDPRYDHPAAFCEVEAVILEQRDAARLEESAAAIRGCAPGSPPSNATLRKIAVAGAVADACDAILAKLRSLPRPADAVSVLETPAADTIARIRAEIASRTEQRETDARRAVVTVEDWDDRKQSGARANELRTLGSWVSELVFHVKAEGGA